MRINPFFLIGILVCLWATPVLAEPLENAEYLERAESFRKAIAETKDEREQALLHKRLGDLYVSREEYGKAADEFVQALTLAPSAFTEQERLRMAITMSWANRSNDAAAILRSILSEDPNNRDARVHLAKILSWTGKLREADSEADRVLHDDPNNQDALLVKANILRWQGDAKGSIQLYEKALQPGEHFDARLGLAYAQLDIGEWKRARENAALLTPQYPYQDKELQNFEKAFSIAKAPHAALQYSYYHDSDDNKVMRTTLSYGFKTGLGEVGVSYRLTDANDPVRSISAQDLLVQMSTRRGSASAGMALGVSRPDDGNITVGSVRVDNKVGWGMIGLSLSRELMTDTAELIENKIVRTGESLSLVQNITQRTSLSESYTHASYSDSNHSDDILVGVRNVITFATPRIAAGYRFRYWNFERQSNGGYFDPENFMSHQIFASLSAEQGGWYANLEPYVGLQSFTRYGEYTSEIFYGATAAAGWTMKKSTSLEVNGEGGNYAGGTAAGYNYYLVGFRLIVYF